MKYKFWIGAEQHPMILFDETNAGIWLAIVLIPVLYLSARAWVRSIRSKS